MLPAGPSAWRPVLEPGARTAHVDELGPSDQAFAEDLPFLPFLPFLTFFAFMPFIPLIPFIDALPNRSATELVTTLPDRDTLSLRAQATAASDEGEGFRCPMRYAEGGSGELDIDISLRAVFAW